MLEKLYALSIAGRTFFLSGTLSTKECQLIDSIANSFVPLASENEKQLCQRFLAEVHEKVK